MSGDPVGGGPAGSAAAGGAPPVPLRRLLPRQEAEAQLLVFLPLLEGHAIELLDEDGRLLATAGRPSEAEAASWPLLLDGRPIGRLRLRPAPAGGAAEAAVAALLTGLQRAANEAALRRALAGEALERYREVNLLYRLGEVLGGAAPEALPALLLEEALRAVPAEAGLLRLDPFGQEEALLLAHGFDRGPGRADLDPAALLALLQARPESAERSAILGPEASAEAGLPPRALLWAPLRVGERPLGGLLLCRAADGPEFSAGEAKLLGSLAGQAATVVHNARLQLAALEQARMARELQLAYEVQEQLMPTTLPVRKGLGWKAAADWWPAREVAGDFYDATLEDDLLTVAVGDVADKGMAAALFMALTRSTLRASASPGRSAAEVVARANALLCTDANDGMFVTLAYGMLRPDGRASCVVAGHNPPLLLRADGRVERLGMTGILVGWDAEAAYGQVELQLGHGDLLLLYTDGLTEAVDAKGQAYGEERMEEVAKRHRHEGPDALLNALRADLTDFVGQAPPHDDTTLLVVGRADPAFDPLWAPGEA